MPLQKTISALNAAQKGFSNVATNLLSQATTAGKTLETQFKSIVGGDTTGGVSAVTIQNVGVQGLLKSTAFDTDIAVAGNGFFVAGKYGGLTGTQTNEFSFTRAGSFRPDSQGYLTNSSGLYLQGWPTDTSGDPTVTDLNALSGLQTIRMNQIAGITTATTNIELKVNLPALLTVGDSVNSSIEIYNSLGEASSLNFAWTKISNLPLTWNLTVTSSSGATVTQGDGLGGSTGNAYAAFPVIFDGYGNPDIAAAFNGGVVVPPIYIDWATATTPSSAAASNIDLFLGTPGLADGISCRAQDYTATAMFQDGKGPGQLSGVTIDKDGIVSAQFSNGQSLKIYKVPLANFASPHMLRPLDGDAWAQTDTSGNFLLSSARTSGMGSIESKALEQSTVEIAAELTNMMEIERFYSSNTKVIQTDESMFSDLKQLFR